MPNAVTDQQIALIDEALRRNKVPHNTRLYRRANLQFFEVASEAGLFAKTGSEFRVKGFISATARRRDVKPEYGPVFVKVIVPAGTPAAYIEPISTARKSDNEVLLGRNRRVTIAQIERDRHGELVVTIYIQPERETICRFGTWLQ